jgi:hypothetical protein
MQHEPARRIAVAPASVVRSVGLPTPGHVEYARALLADLPVALAAAARDEAQAVILVYALLLDAEPAVQEKQLEIVRRAEPSAAVALAELGPIALALPARSRLPLLQLALGALRSFDPAGLDRFMRVLDELVHADARVTPFEFALQKMLTHHLRLAHQPGAAGDEIYSFTAVAPDLEVVLSALAHVAAPKEADAARAFAAGLSQLRMLESPLALRPAESSGLEQLDAALERLERASLPIKKRLITAAGYVVAADGTVGETEAELLRAICAALDCPMPPLV